MSEAKIEQAAESSLAKLVGRLATPVMLGVAAWFLSGISETQAEQGRDIASIKSDVRDIGTRMDVQVLAQLQDLRKRLEIVEAQQKQETTP